jgi:hypothetical protein
MKKLLVLGLLLSMSTGCGRGWLPCLFRGAPCNNGNCIGAAPALPNCENCGNAAGYGGYQSEVADGSYYGGGQIIHEGPIYGGSGSMVNPPMSNIQQPAT